MRYDEREPLIFRVTGVIQSVVAKLATVVGLATITLLIALLLPSWIAYTFFALVLAFGVISLFAARHAFRNMTALMSDITEDGYRSISSMRNPYDRLLLRVYLKKQRRNDESLRQAQLEFEQRSGPASSL